MTDDFRLQIGDLRLIDSTGSLLATSAEPRLLAAINPGGGTVMRKLVIAVCSILFLGIPATAVARQSNDDERQPLYGNLGPHNRIITTTSDMAQAYFNEGLQFMYAFGPSSALLSFREAQKHDPNCAMCYWGEAWALSPYLNGEMRPAAEKEAYAAIRRA